MFLPLREKENVSFIYKAWAGLGAGEGVGTGLSRTVVLPFKYGLVPKVEVLEFILELR